jgi:hypothetical protein
MGAGQSAGWQQSMMCVMKSAPGAPLGQFRSARKPFSFEHDSVSVKRDSDASDLILLNL